MSLKQDRQGARTPADLERRYNFGKSFAEIMGVATDAQTHAVKAEELANELSWLLKDEKNGLIAKMEMKLDTADLISKFNLAANEVTIKSDNFTLSADGTVTATNGTFHGKVVATEGSFTGKVVATEGSFTGTVYAESGSFKGTVIATSGSIGDWSLSDGSLFATKKIGEEIHQTVIEPNNVETYWSNGSQTRHTQLADGNLHIVRYGSGIVMPTFASFEFNGKTYSLYVDFANGNVLKAYDWGNGD